MCLLGCPQVNLLYSLLRRKVGREGVSAVNVANRLAIGIVDVKTYIAPYGICALKHHILPHSGEGLKQAGIAVSELFGRRNTQRIKNLLAPFALRSFGKHGEGNFGTDRRYNDIAAAGLDLTEEIEGKILGLHTKAGETKK